MRKSGILMPVFSLPGRYGCGSFGKHWANLLRCVALPILPHFSNGIGLGKQAWVGLGRTAA